MQQDFEAQFNDQSGLEAATPDQLMSQSSSSPQHPHPPPSFFNQIPFSRFDAGKIEETVCRDNST